jgi:hypothetical protein
MTRFSRSKYIKNGGKSDNRAVLIFFMIAVLSSLSIIIFHLHQTENEMVDAFKRSRVLLDRLLADDQGTANSALRSDGAILRQDIGSLLQKHGCKIGVELGAKSGLFSSQLLEQWMNCTRFYVVDIWQSQSGSFDTESSKDFVHQEEMFEARRNLKQYSNRTKLFFMPMLTSDAIEFIRDVLDFVYIDTLQDYCTVKTEIENWWPKIRNKGFLAGSNFLNSTEMRLKNPSQDWSKCADGSIHVGATKQAVLEIVEREGLELIVTADEWPTWMVRKVRKTQARLEAVRVALLEKYTHDVDQLISSNSADTWSKFHVITCYKAQGAASERLTALTRHYCASVGCDLVVHSPASLAGLPAPRAQHPQRVAAGLIEAALSGESPARLVVWVAGDVALIRAGVHPAELLQGYHCAVAMRSDGRPDASVLILRNTAWARRLVSRWRASLDCSTSDHPSPAAAGPCCVDSDCFGPALHEAVKTGGGGTVRYVVADEAVCRDGGYNDTAVCRSWALRVIAPAVDGDAAGLSVISRRYGDKDPAGSKLKGLKVVSFSDRSTSDVIVGAAFRILQVRPCWRRDRRAYEETTCCTRAPSPRLRLLILHPR